MSVTVVHTFTIKFCTQFSKTNKDFWDTLKDKVRIRSVSGTLTIVPGYKNKKGKDNEETGVDDNERTTGFGTKRVTSNWCGQGNKKEQCLPDGDEIESCQFGL